MFLLLWVVVVDNFHLILVIWIPAKLMNITLKVKINVYLINVSVQPSLKNVSLVSRKKHANTESLTHDHLILFDYFNYGGLTQGHHIQ